MLFLEADDDALLRRYSETRRPHPLGQATSVKASLLDERERLQPVRAVADLVVDTTKFNVHELRSLLTERFQSTDAQTEPADLVRELRLQQGRAGRR